MELRSWPGGGAPVAPSDPDFVFFFTVSHAPKKNGDWEEQKARQIYCNLDIWELATLHPRKL